MHIFTHYESSHTAANWGKFTELTRRLFIDCLTLEQGLIPNTYILVWIIFNHHIYDTYLQYIVVSNNVFTHALGSGYTITTLSSARDNS
jgi:hypothetical protein